MAKNKHGRGRSPQRRRPNPRPVRVPHEENAEDQQLFQGLRQALRSDGPIELLAMMSGFVAVTDPRARDPFARDVQAPDLGDLVESFVGTSYADTTAALMVIRALVTDELMQARISRELAQRRHPMPDWLSGLDRSQIEPEVWFLTHVLGDGDDYLIGVRLPSGHSLSFLVYVDHNLGTVVKDAFVVPEPLEDFALTVGTTLDDPDQSLTRTDPATARAVIEAAIEQGSRFYPPLSSDSWPMCRPLVEWVLRQLPSGAVAPERKEWSEEETAAIATDFFASRFGAAVDYEDERSLLETVLWFGTDYATGDPFRWSPVTVELLLEDWFPRKVVADPAYLAKLPDLVRAFIRYGHDRLGIRAALTAETLAAVDHYEPDYQRAIRTVRPQGPAALMARLFEGEDVEDDLSTGDILLEGLDRKVGGRMQLHEPRRRSAAGRAVRVGRHPRRRATGGPRGAGPLRPLRRRAARHRAPHRHATVPQQGRCRRPGHLPAQGLAGTRCCCRGLGDLPGQRHGGRLLVGPLGPRAPGVVRRQGQRLAAR